MVTWGRVHEHESRSVVKAGYGSCDQRSLPLTAPMARWPSTLSRHDGSKGSSRRLLAPVKSELRKLGVASKCIVGAVMMQTAAMHILPSGGNAHQSKR